MKRIDSPEYEVLLDKFFDAAAEVRRVRKVLEGASMFDSIEDCNQLEEDLSFAIVEFRKAECAILNFEG